MMLRSSYTTRTGEGSSYPTCFSYNPSSKPKPTLINNIYVEHLLETADDEMLKHEIRLAIMDERMRREEFILATSPHKVVANAVRYARAMNYTLSSLLDRRLKLLHEEFEQEFRRIVEVQQEAYRDNPNFYKKSSGFTRKQFRNKVSDVLSSKRREDELRRAKTQLSLPSMTNSPSLSRQNKFISSSPEKPRLQKVAWHKKQTEVSRGLTDDEKVAAVGRQYMTITSWKHDGEAVYFPPI